MNIFPTSLNNDSLVKIILSLSLDNHYPISFIVNNNKNL